MKQLIKQMGLIGTLSSTIIGAGMFSLPFVFSVIGIVNGLLFLIFFLLIYTIIHLMYAELIEKNPGMEFGSLARKYFGEKGKYIQWFVFLELLFVCFAYLVLAPQFLSLIFNADSFLFFVVFWVFGVLGMFFSMGGIAFFESLGLLAIIALIGVVGGSGFLSSNQAVFYKDIKTISDFFLPFGPILFALSGRPIIARITREAKKGNMGVKKIIIFGTLIPAVLYAIYSIGFLKIQPIVTTDIISAIKTFPVSLSYLIGALGVVVLWTSYFVISLNARDILVLDGGYKKSTAFLFVAIIPAVLYMINTSSFISVVSFVGAIFLAIEGVCISLMWWKEERRKRFFVFVITTTFLIAAIQEIVSFI